ncbi:MAG: class I SAM-dependent methyltransferase [Kiritimatiellaeota bacterium]|nr:class I SAM-dependent methyltransferase [Kiritimatiellota bacterium]
MTASGRRYWDGLAAEYVRRLRISTEDFHYGPLLPGDRELRLLPCCVAGWSCLELGCGAGQNSIFLARRGALAAAIDQSAAMIGHGRMLARQVGAPVRFMVGDVDRLPVREGPRFHLVHSSYALPFVTRPERVIAESAKRLRPGGLLLISTAHPAAAGEWIDLGDEGPGLFLADYYHPRIDRRLLKGAEACEVCRPVPLSMVFSWLRTAGLDVLQFLEPAPPPLLPAMSEQEIQDRIPYDSPGWREHYEELLRIPHVAVFLARRPG